MNWKDTKLEIKTWELFPFILALFSDLALSSCSPSSLESAGSPLPGLLGLSRLLVIFNHAQPSLGCRWQRRPCSQAAVNLSGGPSCWLLISRVSVECRSQTLCSFGLLNLSPLSALFITGPGHVPFIPRLPPVT